MKMKAVSVAALLPCAMIAYSSECAERQWAHPELVAKVESGELTEANVSWWGYDRNDSTKYLQAALDSKARKVTLDRQDAPWYTRPLLGRSNLELVVPEGVELCAKRGEYQDQYDAMLRFICCTNLSFSGGGVMKMWIEDYTNKNLYVWSEWRHTLALQSCANVVIENLRIIDSGGDGIYLGRKGSVFANTDVTIRNVTLSRNNRQGISVISADRLLIENCVMENTCGTPPMAGIDFEPNSPQEMLRDIIMRNCIVRGNHGAGFDFSVCNLSSASPDMSIVIENCRSEGNLKPLKFHLSSDALNKYRGSVEFRKCVFDDVGGSRDPFRCRSKSGRHTYSVKFEDCLAADPEKGGALTLLGPEYGWGRIEPPRWADGSPFKLMPTQIPDVAKTEVRDSAPGVAVRLNPVCLRGRAQYFVYADSARTIKLKAMVNPVGRMAFESCQFRLHSATGAVVGTVNLIPEFRKEQTLPFKVPERGFYRLSGWVSKSHAITLTESDVPVALVNSAFYGVPGWSTLPGGGYLVIPDGVKRFAVSATGGGGNEMLHAKLVDPDGKCIWDEDNIVSTKLWISPENPRAGVWELRSLKATSGGMDDYYFSIFGIPYQLFLCREKYWMQ